MLPRLARRWFLAALVMGALTAPASSQTLSSPDSPASADPTPGLSPLWADAALARFQNRAAPPLAPFVTAALPEDAAWEGFTAPGVSGSSFYIGEWQGKLVLAGNV